MSTVRTLPATRAGRSPSRWYAQPTAARLQAMNPDLAAREVAAALAARLVGAWAAHDMAAFAGNFHEDAAFVNVAGAYACGRAEIEELHAAAHASIFRDSTITMELMDVRVPADTVLIAHVRSELRGDARAPAERRHSILTIVIERRAGEWKVSAAQNTTVR